MSEPNNPMNQPFEEPTDPTSQLIKNNAAAPDPGLAQEKWMTPGTDPISGLATPGGRQPGPIGYGTKAPGPNGYSDQAAGPGANTHGVRNTIIIVCLVGLLLIGGGFIFLNPTAGQGTIVIRNKPGVIQWLRQLQVSSSTQEQLTASGMAQCATSSSQGGLVERLVGGGYTSDDDQGMTLHALSSYPSGNNDGWKGDFISQAQGHKATVIAICLREPAAFFDGLQTFDSVQSAPRKAARDDKNPSAALAVAACPVGAAILGGGYASESSGGVYSIDASYPVYENGVGEWVVAFHVDPSNGAQSVQLTAYAICAQGLTTHLEHQAIPGITETTHPNAQGSMTCASGTLLMGGYQITAPPSLVGIGADSPLNDITRTPRSGDFVQQWYVGASSAGWQPGVSPGELWVTCLDTLSGTAPGATASSAPVTQPTSTPGSAPTATPRPRPTRTPTPSCVSIVNGSGAMNVDNIYLNVDSSTGIGHSSTGAQARWDQTGAAILPINGAAFSDQGMIGATGYRNLTCAQLKSASYTAPLVRVVNGEVFLVKTPGGHLAKALITLTPGNPAPTLTWVTYKP